MTTMTNAKGRVIFDSDKDGRLKLKEQLSVLAMSPAQKKKITRKMAMEVRSLARRNIRQQKTVYGSTMEKRSDQRNKRKMMRGLAKTMVAFSKNSDAAVVTWKDRRNANIAYQQQHGGSTRMTARKAAKLQAPVNDNDMATRDQAKALLAEGYRQPIRAKNGGSTTRRASQRWIKQNLSMQQAGYILRILRNDQKKQSWAIKLPARPFLGASDDQADNFRHQLAKSAIRQMIDKGAN